MYKLSIFLCLVTFMTFFASAQQAIKGKVVDAGNGSPVFNVNVFISGSTKGTVTDQYGIFELHNIPAGKYELVISCIGYETTIYPFSDQQLPLQLKIELPIKVKELENVTIEASVEENWNKWGATFEEYFIGKTKNAAECKIKNREAIKFRYFNQSGRLTAYAGEPILIENKALGYIIQYQMEAFELNFKQNSTFFIGYPLFIGMSSDKEKMNTRWYLNRIEAYKGSIMHFMRSLYNNELQQEGFTVKRYWKIANQEKFRLISKYHVSNSHKVKQPKDSAAYYKKILEQDSYTEIYGEKPLTADSLVIGMDGDIKLIGFDETIFILFRDSVNEHSPYRWSHAKLLNEKEIAVGKNGSYNDPRDFYSSGWWSMSERVANMLPWDYETEKAVVKTPVTQPPVQEVIPAIKKPARHNLGQKSIVKDSLGTVYPYFLWQPMLASGKYTVVAVDSMDKNTEFLLYQVIDESQGKPIIAGHKPPESPFFRTGDLFDPLRVTDIHGKLINTAGKTLVINYWFINCPPCQREIPKLNELVAQYSPDSNVVFLAIALDKKDRLRSFVQRTPFNYSIISEGRYLANEHRIYAFPTHVVVNSKGRIVFHCAGYSNSIGYWLENAIEESKTGKISGNGQ